MKKRINKKWLAGLIVMTSILWSGIVSGVELPFYAQVTAKPNVLLLLDNSGSMDWAIDGTSPEPGESSRWQIAQRVLTGTGIIPVTYNGEQVYLGKLGGELSVYNDLDAKGVFQKILLLHKDFSNNYELVTVQYYQENFGLEEFYFTFKNMYDHPLQTGNATTENATYNFDKFLRDYNAESAELIVPGNTVASSKDITNDGVPIKRVIYKAKIAGSEFDDLMVANYGQYDNLIITRLARDTTCYKTSSGGSNRTCYKPAPLSSFPPCPSDSYRTTTYFVVWNANDFNNNTALMNSAKMTLYQFIQYVQACSGLSNANTYNSYRKVSSQQIVCGDGTNEKCPPPNPIPCYGYPNATCSDSTCCPTYWPRTTGYRDIYELVPDGTSGATKVISTPWTKAGIESYIISQLDKAQEVDAWGPGQEPDGIVGNEFIKTTGNYPTIDVPIREQLGYTPASVTFTIDDPSFNHFFEDNEGNFSPLPYTALSVNRPGIMDLYDVRYGLMTFDSGGNNDFPGYGGNLIYNLSEGSTYNTYIQEIIACRDENQDGLIADGNHSCIDTNAWTPIAGMLRDAFSYLYGRYFLSCNATGDQPYCCGHPSFTSLTNRGCDYNITTPSQPRPAPLTPSLSGYSINPSPFNQWDPGQWNMQDFNGHVLLNDPYYYYGCRSNNIILITDGGQSQGEPYTGTYAVDTTNEFNQVSTVQTKYVRWFTNPSQVPGIGTPPSGSWTPTKLYFIGFALQGSQSSYDVYAEEMLNAMALASDLPDDPEDVTTPFWANSEQELVQQLDIIMKTIMKGTYSRTAPVISTNLNSGAAGYFDIKPMEELLWMGHLVYTDLASFMGMEEGTTASIEATVDAAELLNDRADNTREIFTSVYNQITNKWERVEFTSDNAGTLMSFLLPGYPTYNDYLDQNGDSVLNITDARMLIDFVRVKDGSTYKGGDPRNWKLGAIYHSTPVSAGAPPSEALKNLASYQAFAAEYADAPELIYVGALDGMLHTFFFNKLSWGSTLSEAWAYVPNSVLQNLWHLRLGEQEIYVDGDPSIAVMRASVDSPPNKEWCDQTDKWCWQTILFQGLRDGGPAYFSLNVTDMNTVEGQSGKDVKVRWEFTDPDEGNTVDSILGNSWSLPLVDELLYKPQDSSTLDTRVVVMFGGGKSRTLKPYEGSWFYILNADNGSPIRTLLVPSTNQSCDIEPGELLTEGNFRDKCNLAVENHNQIVTDVLMLDMDFDGFSDVGYFGDMEGRVWKINVHDPNPDNWGICLFFDTGDTGYDDLSNPEAECDGDLREYGDLSQPACVNSSKRRPFYYRADATRAPEGKGWLIYVGTGHVDYEPIVQDPSIRNYVFALLDEDNIDECSYATIWKGAPGDESGWPIQLGQNEKLTSGPKVTLSQGKYQGEVTFQSYSPFETTNPCVPGTTYKWRVDFDTGAGAVFSNGEWVRKSATEGFPGTSLVLGNIEISYTPPSEQQQQSGQKGEMSGLKQPIQALQGIYYWWLR